MPAPDPGERPFIEHYNHFCTNFNGPLLACLFVCLFACLFEYRMGPRWPASSTKRRIPTHRHQSQARTRGSLPTDPSNPQSLNPPQHKTEECAEGSTKPGRLSSLAHEGRKSGPSCKTERGYIRDVTEGTFDELNYRQGLKAFPKSSLEMLRDKTVELIDISVLQETGGSVRAQ